MLGTRSSEEDDDAGIVSRCPIRINDPLRLLADAIRSIDTPYCREMCVSVSPARTVWVVAERFELDDPLELDEPPELDEAPELEDPSELLDPLELDEPVLDPGMVRRWPMRIRALEPRLLAEMIAVVLVP